LLHRSCNDAGSVELTGVYLGLFPVYPQTRCRELACERPFVSQGAKSCQGKLRFSAGGRLPFPWGGEGK
ncbi:hypothetical protein MYX77_14825, partial [Acidobacteriia bacterium AH_259_A11_L15]|nr:hypothetical protein [Acidobacteriia bacterium AH_259_A11_L15]